jgi:cytochrome d ubiquinol oxidase subunit II
VIGDVAHAVAGVLIAALALYLLGGGADFGGGIWELFAFGRGGPAQRRLIEREIGPIWEANHVWFIFVFTVYFAAFPPAFAATVRALFLPLTWYAIGIVARGAAFTFRHYAPNGAHRKVWSPAFAAASVACPFLLGAMGAAMLRETPLDAPLFDAFTVVSGLFVVALLAALAAVYLSVAAARSPAPAEPDAETGSAPAEAFRKRAIAALAIAGMLGTLALVLAHRALNAALAFRLLLLWASSAVFGLAAAVAVFLRAFRVGRVLTAGLVVLVVVGWAFAKGQRLVTTSAEVWTVDNAKAHAATLTTLLGSIGLGALLLVPSLVLLYRVFASAPKDVTPTVRATARATPAKHT